MKKWMYSFLLATLVAGLVGFTSAQADEKEEGGKAKNPTTLGLLESVDTQGKTLVLRAGKVKSTLMLGEQIEIKIDDKAAKLADVKPGTAIRVKLADDKKTVVGIEAGAKIRLGEGKPEGKEAPAPKRPEGKEAPAPKRPEGKEAPAPKRPEGKEAPAPKRPEGKEAPAPKRPEGKEAPAPKRPEGI